MYMQVCYEFFFCTTVQSIYIFVIKAAHITTTKGKRHITFLLFLWCVCWCRTTYGNFPLWIMVKKVKKEDVHASVLRIFFLRGLCHNSCVLISIKFYMHFCILLVSIFCDILDYKSSFERSVFRLKWCFYLN